MKSMCVGSAVAALLVAAGSANAALFFGAESSGSTGDIYPSGGITNGSFEFHGGQGFFLSAIDVNDAVDLDWNGSGPWNRGEAVATATLGVGNTPPTVKAESRLTGNYSTITFNGDSPVGASSFALAGALEPFQYIGAVATTLSLTYTLEADVATNAQDFWMQTGAGAQFGVWDDQLTFYATDNGSLGEGGASMLSHDGNDAKGSMFINGTTSGLTSVSVTVFFDVTPGQIFHVNARVGTAALYGQSFADAFHTFGGSFGQPDLVQSVVPAPGCAGLLALGMLVGSRRRR